MYIYIHAGVPVGSRGLYLSAEKGVFLVTWTRRLMKSHVRLHVLYKPPPSLSHSLRPTFVSRRRSALCV